MPFDHEMKTTETDQSALGTAVEGDIQKAQKASEDGQQGAVDGSPEEKAAGQEGAGQEGAEGSDNSKEADEQKAEKGEQKDTYTQVEVSKMQSSFQKQVNEIRSEAQRMVNETRQELREGLDAVIETVKAFSQSAMSVDGQKLAVPQRVTQWEKKAGDNERVRAQRQAVEQLGNAVEQTLADAGVDPNTEEVNKVLEPIAAQIGQGKAGPEALWSAANKLILDSAASKAITNIEDLKKTLEAELTPQIERRILAKAGITQQDVGGGSGLGGSPTQLRAKLNEDFNKGKITQAEYEAGLDKLPK